MLSSGSASECALFSARLSSRLSRCCSTSNGPLTLWTGAVRCPRAWVVRSRSCSWCWAFGGISSDSDRAGVCQEYCPLSAGGSGSPFPPLRIKKPGTLHSGPGKIHNYKTKDIHYEHSTNKGRIPAAPVPVLPLVSKPFTML